jgi:hypothetical protein
VVSQPTICSGNFVTLTGVGNAVTYSWTNGSSTTGNGSNWFPTVNTNYTVTAYSAQNCSATAQTMVTVVTTPIAPPIASPALICIGSTATLSSSGATNYTWTTPTGTLSTSQITVNPTTTTAYTLTKANSNCVNTQTVGLIVNQLPPVVAIVSPTLICASRPATLQGAGAATFTWVAAGPPSFSATGSSPIVSPSVATMYTVTASDGTCVNTATVLLSVDPNPTINIAVSSSVICRGDQVTLNASGAIGYSWTTSGITSNTNAASITETPNASTLYDVTGINNFNCTSTKQQVVVVNPTPTLVVSSNKPMVCSLAPANLTVTGANSYLWDANANNATTSVTTVNPPSTTVYSVTGTYSATQCKTTQTIQIIVFQPTFAVNSPTSSCQGGTINLIASGANTYTWNGNQPFAQISVSPPTATVYPVAATSSSLGVSCVSTNSVIVTIYANPTITAAPQKTLICKYEGTNLQGFGGVSYQWSTGQTGSLVPVSPLANTIYTVEGTDQNGCKGTTSVQLKISTCAGIGEHPETMVNVLSIYPNPSAGEFNIQSTVSGVFNIVNELGQIVRTVQLDSTNEKGTRVKGLTPGVYFVQNNDGKPFDGQKVIVNE